MTASATHNGWLTSRNNGILAAVKNGALNGASVLTTNTALTGVLVGTPVTPALAADSMVISNLVASGDILIAANNGGNSQAWLWVDSSAGTLTLYGAGTAALTISSTAVKSSLALSPLTSDGAALGSASLMWADLFLASGAVINFDNGDVTLTHAANSLAIAGGDVTLASGFGLNVGSTTQATISDGDGATNLIPEVQALGVGTAFAGGALLLGTFNATNDRTVSPKLAFLKGAAATQVATTAVANDEVVGSIIAYGSDSADFETPVAAIEFVVDDAGGPGASAIGGSIEFYTTADGGTTLTKAFTIDTAQKTIFSGAVDVGLSGTGYDVTLYGDTAGCSLLWDQSEDQLVVTQTNAATTGVERTLDVSQTHTGVGASAEALRSVLTSNVALGTYANAIFGKVDLSTSGEVTGLIGVICAEVTMPSSDAPSGGEYAAFEAEFNMAGANANGRPLPVMDVNVWGGNETEFDTNGLLFDITGVTTGTGKFFRTNAVAFNNCDAFLKCRVGGTAYYIPLSDNQAGT